jgi:hypothetical protein
LTLDQFFGAFIGSDMREYLRSMVFSSFFLLSCGAVVQVKEAQDGLKKIVKE